MTAMPVISTLTIWRTRWIVSIFIVENDSWEKLEKDLDRCISTSNPRRYYSLLGLMCKAAKSLIEVLIWDAKV